MFSSCCFDIDFSINFVDSFGFYEISIILTLYKSYYTFNFLAILKFIKMIFSSLSFLISSKTFSFFEGTNNEKYILPKSYYFNDYLEGRVYSLLIYLY